VAAQSYGLLRGLCKHLSGSVFHLGNGGGHVQDQFDGTGHEPLFHEVTWEFGIKIK
jgi:hypothetical protein